MRRFQECFLSVGWVLILATAMLGIVAERLPAQTPQEARVQELLDRFDDRLPEVQTLVDSSRNPAANSALLQAIQFRNQAETQLRAGNTDVAFNLANRALDRLKQAEDLARQGTGTEEQLAQLRRMLDIQRQRLQDTQRLISDVESEVGDSAGLPGGPVLSLFERQRDRTSALIERAEECCQSDGPISPTNIAAGKCRDLIARARQLYDQAIATAPDTSTPIAVDDRVAENRLRDARQLVERTQAELDLIERELDSGNPASASSLAARLRNTSNQNRLANDRLSDAGVAGSNLIQNQTGTALGLLRRASDLARSALAACEGSDTVGLEQFENQNQVVESLAERVEGLLQDNANAGVPAYDRATLLFDQATEMHNQAQQQALQGRYGDALNRLSQAATLLNQALAALDANASLDSRLATLENLQSQYDRKRAQIETDGTLSAPCALLLEQADQLRQDSENLAAEGPLEGAFAAINQGQRRLAEAFQCLGLSVPRIEGLLDRLQAEYDRRRPTVSGDAGVPAAQVLVQEADDLRNLSDNQESQSRFEEAIQTVGRAITALGNALRLVSAQAGDRESEILARLQDQFDQQIPAVEERVNQVNSLAAVQSLNQAQTSRQQSEASEGAGNVSQALSEIGRAIQLLEQAVLQTMNTVGSPEAGP